MGKKYTQLTLDERCTISTLQKEGKSIRQIGAALARSPSTISREIKRNSVKTKGYRPGYAEQMTLGRRWQGSRLERQPKLRKDVLDLLAMGWSPQQVSQRLALDRGCPVISYESIYRFIYAQIKRTKKYTWRHYLPYQKSKRGWRGRKGGSPVDFMKDRVSIHKRPKYIEKRKSPGHWEADLMLFSKYSHAILVVHERFSRLTMLFKLPNKGANSIIDILKALFQNLPQQLVKTVTFDNGTEFAHHHQLNKLGIKTYFCDVRSPWQKGGIENTIGRLRRVLPRKTNIVKLKNMQIDDIVMLYNNTPRKCLGYRSPSEIFLSKLLHFKCESTLPHSRE